MKQQEEDITLQKRFNKLVFISLATLGLFLIGMFFYDFFESKLGHFSKEDYQNELMGQAYFASLNKNYNAEIILYKKVLEKIPEMEAELSLKIGTAYYELGNFKNALNNYNKALKLGYIDSCSVFFHVALTAQKLRSYEMAVKYYRKAMADPKHVGGAYFNLGNIYNFQYKNEDLALDFYLNSLETQSASSAYQKMLWREKSICTQKKDSAMCHFISSEIDKDKDDTFFSRYDILEFDNTKPDKTQALIHNYIGIIQGNRNNKIEAISHFHQAMSIDPEFKDARFNFQKIISEVKNK